MSKLTALIKTNYTKILKKEKLEKIIKLCPQIAKILGIEIRVGKIIL